MQPESPIAHFSCAQLSGLSAMTRLEEPALRAKLAESPELRAQLQRFLEDRQSELSDSVGDARRSGRTESLELFTRELELTERVMRIVMETQAQK